MTSSNGNIFRITGPLCREFAIHRWTLRTKASDAELWCFLWSAPWINVWINNREAGDSKRHRTHYDITVMTVPWWGQSIGRQWISTKSQSWGALVFLISSMNTLLTKQRSAGIWDATRTTWRHCNAAWVRYGKCGPHDGQRSRQQAAVDGEVAPGVVLSSWINADMDGNLYA